MNHLELEKYQHQIETNHGIGIDLLKKVEFEFLAKQLFETEQLNSLAVVTILGKLYLVGFTDQRFLMVEKNNLKLFKLQRYGLEQIVDLKLIVEDQATNLVIILLNHEQLKLYGLSENNAKQFGQNLVESIRQWNDRTQEI